MTTTRPAEISAAKSASIGAGSRPSRAMYFVYAVCAIAPIRAASSVVALRTIVIAAALPLRRVAHVVVDEIAHLRARHHHGAHLLAHVGRNRIVGHELDRVARLGGEFLVVVEALDAGAQRRECGG